MENIKIHIDELTKEEHVVIERNDGSFLTMLKSTWDELEAQREQSGTL